MSPDPVRQHGPSWSGAAVSWPAGILLVVSAFLLWWARERPFRGEEIEHVHAAWRVAQGAVPYLDFFEHHHPLLWYLLAGALPWVGESGATIPVLRMALLPVALLTLALTGLLALEATGSRRIAWTAAILLGSTIAFLETGVAVRPDSPMVLFGTLCTFLLLRAQRTGRGFEAAAAGVALGIAFCFLQKAVLLLLALVLAGTIRKVALGRAIPLPTVASFSLGLGGVVLAGGLFLAMVGGLDDYLWTNWVFNGIVSAELARIPTTGVGLVVNLPFWLLLVVGSVLVIACQRSDDALFTTALITLALLAALAAARAVRWHYLLQAMPMGAVVGGWALQRLFERARLSPVSRLAVLLTLVAVPLGVLAHSLRRTSDGQRAAIDYVLRRSAPGDPMFDPAFRFNLFRPDLHYFAEVPTDRSRLLEWYRRAAGSRLREYDACQLLREKRPRFVSDVDHQLSVCGQADLYAPTPFEAIYGRDD
jgi:hypothetical protein